MKMKSCIQEIKKETVRLLSNYLGLDFENKRDKSNNKIKNTQPPTPDFYNSRLNTGHRKNLNANRFPQ